MAWKFSSHQKKNSQFFNSERTAGELAWRSACHSLVLYNHACDSSIHYFKLSNLLASHLLISACSDDNCDVESEATDTITVWSTEAQRTLQPKHVRPYSKFYFHLNRIDQFFNKPDVRIRLVHTLGTAVLYCLLHFNNSSDTGMWVPITAMVPFIFVTIVRAEAWDVFVWESARFLWVHQFSISVSNLDPALANCKTG